MAMNVSLLENFKKEMGQIREYIKHIQSVNNIAIYDILDSDNKEIKSLLRLLKSHYKSFRIEKRIFEYKAIVISLYGILERFVEVWIKEFLDALSRIVPDYNDIDEKIREKHFELSIKLLDTITYRENAKFQHLKKEEVLHKLNDCILNPESFKINTEAFVILSGNLKHNRIVELFKMINIDLNCGLRSNQNFIQYIKSEQQTDIIGNLPTEILYYMINDLVERRNEIAHGSESVSNILGNSELEKYIEFLEQYCEAIFEILREETIKQDSVYNFQKIENAIDIFDHKILAFEIEAYEISVGDVIIVRTAEGRFFKRTILEIQIEKKVYEEVKIYKKTNIAVRVEPKIKKNQDFFLRRIQAS